MKMKIAMLMKGRNNMKASFGCLKNYKILLLKLLHACLKTDELVFASMYLLMLLSNSSFMLFRLSGFTKVLLYKLSFIASPSLAESGP
jgi:hypothetical protein